MKSKARIYFIMGTIIAIFLIGFVIVMNTASFQRKVRSVVSDFTGGLNRTVTLYDYNGKPIQSWEGKIDLSKSDQEIFFDLNGKRVIIHGGIVVAEEK